VHQANRKRMEALLGKTNERGGPGTGKKKKHLKSSRKVREVKMRKRRYSMKGMVGGKGGSRGRGVVRGEKTVSEVKRGGSEKEGGREKRRETGGQGVPNDADNDLRGEGESDSTDRDMRGQKRKPYTTKDCLKWMTKPKGKKHSGN